MVRNIISWLLEKNSQFLERKEREILSVMSDKWMTSSQISNEIKALRGRKMVFDRTPIVLPHLRWMEERGVIEGRKAVLHVLTADRSHEIKMYRLVNKVEEMRHAEIKG